MRNDIINARNTIKLYVSKIEGNKKHHLMFDKVFNNLGKLKMMGENIDFVDIRPIINFQYQGSLNNIKIEDLWEEYDTFDDSIDAYHAAIDNNWMADNFDILMHQYIDIISTDYYITTQTFGSGWDVAIQKWKDIKQPYLNRLNPIREDVIIVKHPSFKTGA